MLPATRRKSRSRTGEKECPLPRGYRGRGRGGTGAAGVCGAPGCGAGNWGRLVEDAVFCRIAIHKPHQLAFCFSRRPAYAGRDKGKREDEHRGEIHEVSAFRVRKNPPHRGFRCGGWCNRIWFSSRGRPHKSNPCCTGFAPSGHGSWGCRVRKSPDCPRHRTCRGCRHGR